MRLRLPQFNTIAAYTAAAVVMSLAGSLGYLQGHADGQPKGVIMSAEDIKNCAADTCTVWTESEFDEAMGQVFIEGYKRGVAKRATSIDLDVRPMRRKGELL